MAVVHGGVQANIKDHNPKALFMPYANHSLNIRGVHSLCDFSLLCYLSFSREVLEEVNQTQKFLQTSGLSLEKCVINIKAVTIFLQSQRTQKSYFLRK